MEFSPTRSVFKFTDSTSLQHMSNMSDMASAIENDEKFQPDTG